MNSRDDTFSQEENRDLLPQKDIRRICSLPPELNSTHIRGIITQQVSIQIASLQLDVSRAQSILGTYSDTEFNEKSYNQVINQVVDELQRLQQSQRTEQSLIRQESSPRLPLMRYISSEKQICHICFELQLSINKLDCDHTFCEHCLQEYLVDRIMNGHSDQIICPEDNCSFMVPDQQILDLIGVEYSDKMVKFRKIKDLAKDPNLRQCPRIGCDLFKQRTETHCSCGQEVCLECGSIPHPEISCNKQLDLEFAKVVKQLKIYHCYQCNSPIQKNEGCNHMKCITCNYEFCWLCKSKYTDRHFYKFNIFGCPSMQYSDREPFDYPNIRRFFIFLGVVFLGPPCLLLFLVLYTFCLPSHLHIKIINLKCFQFRRFSCPKQTCYVIFWIFINIALLPLSVLCLCIAIILFLLYLIGAALYLIAKNCC